MVPELQDPSRNRPSNNLHLHPVIYIPVPDQRLRPAIPDPGSAVAVRLFPAFGAARSISGVGSDWTRFDFGDEIEAYRVCFIMGGVDLLFL